MTPELLPIGEMSRRSGLTVSALRFYDREGVLPAATVDPATGYRRYERSQVRHGRLLAGMRRVQMPLAEMLAVLEAVHDREVVSDLLGAHVIRLERGLEQARAEVARLTALADSGGATLTVGAAGLAQALRAVRYAVSADPEFPALGGVLLECLGTDLTVVATDRFRLALMSLTPRTPAERPVSVVLAPEAVAALLAHLPGAGQVGLQVGPAVLRVGSGRRQVLEVPVLDAEFPTYRLLLDAEPAGAVVSLDEVGRALAIDDEEEGEDNSDDDHGDGDSDGVRRSGRDGLFTVGDLRVSRSFLREAVEQVGADGQLTLPTGLGPLVLRDDQGSRLALVMPVAPEPA